MQGRLRLRLRHDLPRRPVSHDRVQVLGHVPHDRGRGQALEEAGLQEERVLAEEVVAGEEADEVAGVAVQVQRGVLQERDLRRRDLPAEGVRDERGLQEVHLLPHAVLGRGVHAPLVPHPEGLPRAIRVFPRHGLAVLISRLRESKQKN